MSPMLKIRFQRIGKKKQAYFRLVVTEHTQAAQGKYHELLGSYDPHKKVINIKSDRVQHWLTQGVTMSPTVNNLLVQHKLLEGDYKKIEITRGKKQVEAPVPTA